MSEQVWEISHDDLAREVGEALCGYDPEFLENIANQVLQLRVEWVAGTKFKLIWEEEDDGYTRVQKLGE